MRKGFAAVAVGLAAVTAVFLLSRFGSLTRNLDCTPGTGRGRDAETPASIPIKGLKDVFWRVVHQLSEDRVTLIAAGVTFYLLLGLFPAMSALVALYGLVADPFDNGRASPGTIGHAAPGCVRAHRRADCQFGREPRFNTRSDFLRQF